MPAVAPPDLPTAPPTAPAPKRTTARARRPTAPPAPPPPFAPVPLPAGWPRPQVPVPLPPDPEPPVPVARQVCLLSEIIPAEQVLLAAGAAHLADSPGGRAYLAGLRRDPTGAAERVLVEQLGAAHQLGLALHAEAGDWDARPEARVEYAGAAARVLKAMAAAADSLARVRTAGAASSGAELGSKGSGNEA